MNNKLLSVFSVFLLIQYVVSQGVMHTFKQTLDHFDPLNPTTFLQRYSVNDTYFTPGNSAFIFLAGEAPMQFFEFQEVFSLQQAKEFGALYISLEHRYYGESNPYGISYSDKSLQYLSSRQALADAANFVETYTANNPDLKIKNWIVWGCSYSGALSAWLRAKYPNIIAGSVAPSGPVLAINNFTQYYGQFSKSANSSCVNAVTLATKGVEQKLKTDSGRKELAKMFHSCHDNIDSGKEYYFKLQLMQTLGSSDQFQNPPGFPLTHACDTMTETSDYVANWAKFMKQSFPKESCINYDEEVFLKELKKRTNPNRSWWFQKCTEFGFFKPGTESIFFKDLTLPYQLRWCEEIFGIPNMQPNIDFTNEYYGAKELVGTNIMFANGLLDPWHNLSILKDNGHGVQGVTFEAGHCGIMVADTPNDAPSTIAARKKINGFLNNIINANK